MYQAGFIGCGNMGGTLAKAAARNLGGDRILVADHHPEKLQALQTSSGAVPASAKEIAKNCRFLFLGVKPQAMPKAVSEIRSILFDRIKEGRSGESYPEGSGVQKTAAAKAGQGRLGLDLPVLVSMAAGLSIESLTSLLAASAPQTRQIGQTGGTAPSGCPPLPAFPIIRIMPNTPVACGEGTILYCMNDAVRQEDEADFLALLQGTGLLQKIEESRIDAASALSGCGPAFVLMFLEAMTEGGIRCGLPAREARELAVQTILGTAKLAQASDQDPAALRLAVCSPAGSTIEGVAALEARAFRSAVLEAVSSSYRRTKEL